MDCKICGDDQMNKPLYLPCAHGYCMSCVIMLIRKRTRKCPLCRHRITWNINQIKAAYPEYQPSKN